MFLSWIISESWSQMGHRIRIKAGQNCPPKKEKIVILCLKSSLLTEGFSSSRKVRVDRYDCSDQKHFILS
jgi:hypothetical protein